MSRHETKDTVSFAVTEATAKDSFMQRICKALDTDAYSLSHSIGVPYEDVMAVWKGQRSEIIDIDIDPMWAYIADHIDARIGALMSVRAEFNMKLERDRKKRAARRDRIANR